MSAVKELFDLPESIHKIGFVQVLSEAVERPKSTAETYVVTPRLLEAFDKALKLVGNAMKTGRSQAAYLHGSFGSGKSHFMALLSLMLSENEEVWRVPEFHGLRERHSFVGTKKLLQLHFHLTGANSLEEVIFAKYISFVRARHPKATIPGVFADEELFENARRLLEELGEEAFFQPMNAGVEEEDEWGEFGGAARWTLERFEAVTRSTDPKEREELFSALVSTRFSAFAQESKKFVDLDSGLGVIGRHAKDLGYDGVVLYLDELILWLASRASDVSWFHNEVQKMVKLVEAQESDRSIPFVSYIARQRDLAEMVGEDYAGAENARVRDSLNWSEGRYETIRLEDRDLPAIAEKRVLRLKEPEAGKKALDEAFERMRRAAGPSWQTLMGQLDATDFRRLYPFSPALVEALVALSNSLQRERTAIKLLTEILVEHAEDLEMGELVGVGDLFDVLAGGEDTADGVMKSRFESAKQLYNYQFLPLIQQAHGTDTAEKCQRLRPDHPARIGCSNCSNKACRADNRLIKTLLISSLVPEVSVLKDVTASRLVQLNHGSLKVPIPGTEASLATQKLKNWASQIGQLHVGSQTDPSVRVQLEGVELAPILEQAARVDTAGARQRVLRDLLFEAMGVDRIADWGRDHVEEWRGTRRLGHIRFGNVRKMGEEQLRCPDNHDWRLIVDYPFDEPNFGPRDDEEVIEKFMEKGDGSWTLVWLPHFFSEPINKMLGELVILEHILESTSTARGYVSHLSVENQNRAMNDLQNLRTQKQSRIRQVLEKAYGLAKLKEDDPDLDHSQMSEQHLVVLKPGARVQPHIAANLADALTAYVPALLEARYPRHPKFTKKLTKNRVEDLVRKFGEIIDAEDKRIPADKNLVEEMRGTLAELGLVRVTETGVHLLEERTLQELEKKRNQQGSDRPEVSEVRRWIDESKKMGLDTIALDLVVRCYARWSARTFVDADQPYEPVPGKPLPEHVVLEKPDLPSPAQWNTALSMAGAALGFTFAGRALHADNLKRFEAEVRAKLKAVASHVTRLPGLLEEWTGAFGIESADRVETAVSADALLSSLDGKSGKGMVESLAAYTPKTSAKAVGHSVGAAEEVANVLSESLVLGVFQQLEARAGELTGAAELLEQVAQVLRQDEVNVKLAPRLKQLAHEGQRMLAGPPPPPPKPGTEVLAQARVSAKGRAAVRAELEKAVKAIEEAVEKGGDAVELTGHLELRGPKP